MRHELKSWPEKFCKIVANVHMVELRINDREYKKGDEILFREWTHDNKYTGQSILTQIVKARPGPWPPPSPILEKVIREGYELHHRSSMRMRGKPIPDIPDYWCLEIALVEEGLNNA